MHEIFQWLIELLNNNLEIIKLNKYIILLIVYQWIKFNFQDKV